jgi:hypothetical protein
VRSLISIGILACAESAVTPKLAACALMSLAKQEAILRGKDTLRVERTRPW